MVAPLAPPTRAELIAFVREQLEIAESHRDSAFVREIKTMHRHEARMFSALLAELEGTQGRAELQARLLAMADEMDGMEPRAWNDVIALLREAAEVESQRDRLRAALVGIVGVDGREDLEQMEAVMRLMAAPAADKAATIDAIHALIASLP